MKKWIQQMKQHRKDQSGQAMIVVLCILAVFVALSFSVLYVSAQLSVGVQNEIINEKCRQQALSYSDVLKNEIIDESTSSDFKTFIYHFIEEEYYAEDTDWYFDTENEADDYGDLQLMFYKKSEDAGAATWNEEPVNNYMLDITVWVRNKNEHGTVLSGSKVTNRYQQVIHWNYTDMVYSAVEKTDGIEETRRLQLQKLLDTGSNEDKSNYVFWCKDTDDYLRDEDGTIITLDRAITQNGKINTNLEMQINLPDNITSNMYTFQYAGRSE